MRPLLAWPLALALLAGLALPAWTATAQSPTASPGIPTGTGGAPGGGPVPPATNVAAIFGAPGVPRFDVHVIPSSLRYSDGAAEPTIGITWGDGHLFFQAYASTYEAVFAENATGSGPAGVSWTDVTPPFTRHDLPIGLQANLDPMLHVDRTTGRIFAGGLLPACSVMGISDDGGSTWVPSGNMCTGTQFDHQAIGTGAWAANALPRNAVAPRAAHYCAQGGLLVAPGPPGAACTTSLDFGMTWQPPVQVLGGCGGFHGHIRVAESTGAAALPFAKCPDKAGFGYTTDNGLTWNSRLVAGAHTTDLLGFDPGLAFTTSGWMYYALADDQGIHVALTKDVGATWEKLGGGMAGTEPATWLDLSDLYEDPMTGNPIHFATFTNVEAGDDDRAAVAFLGTTDPAADDPHSCGEAGEANVWHYYLAQTFDAGQSWTVTRLVEDPIQIGGIWDGGGDLPCRNLLDFNDMEMDAKGRLFIGLADGCVAKCAAEWAAYTAGQGEKPTPEASRAQQGTVLRQATGRGLFAAHDAEAPPPPSPSPTEAPERQTPAADAALAMAGLALAAALAVARRR